jgi:CBS domain-containing protein
VPGECFPIGALLSRRPVRTVHRAAEDTFCFELERDDFNQLLKLSEAFNDFCTRRLASLLDQVHRQVQASAATGLGGDTSLNITLGERLRREPVTCLASTPSPTHCAPCRTRTWAASSSPTRTSAPWACSPCATCSPGSPCRN